MYYVISGRPGTDLTATQLHGTSGEDHMARALGALLFDTEDDALRFITKHGEKWLRSRVTFRPLHRPDETIVWMACTTNPYQPQEEILNHPVLLEKEPPKRPLNTLRNIIYVTIGLPLYGIGHVAYLLLMAASFLITGLVAFTLMIASSVTYAGLVLCGKAGLFRAREPQPIRFAGNVTPINRGAM